MTRASFVKLALFGDSRKGPVAEAMSDFSEFAAGQVEVVARCGVDNCTEQMLEGADFAVVFGGDGSIISVARQLSRMEVPVIGVNLGKLGFLAEFSVTELKDFLPNLTKGEMRIEKRMMLECRLIEGRKSRFRSLAVNDVFITAGPPFRMIELEMSVDGRQLGGCVSDGLVIATPTGSTAYSLSAGGPILANELDAIAITPICPHSLSFRPIVIDSACKIEVSGVRVNEGTTVSIDGQISMHMGLGDVVEVRRAESGFRVVNNPKRTDWQTLATKLGWAEKPKYNAS